MGFVGLELLLYRLTPMSNATHRFTLEQEGERQQQPLSSRSSSNSTGIPQPRPRYRLAREGPVRVFGAEGKGNNDDERNNIVGVTLAGDGTVLVASKVGWGCPCVLCICLSGLSTGRSIHE